MTIDYPAAIVSIAIGLGLAAASGFRVFVPLLAASAAAHWGYLELSPGFAWLSSTPALIAFVTATVLEIGAYYVPWLDHALDAVATPAAVLAGITTSASVLVDLPPLVRWTVALVAGGGAAGLVQGATVLARLKSGTLTGGLANPLIATLELFGAVGTVLLALTLPLAALAIVVVGCGWVFRKAHRVVFGRRGVSVAQAGVAGTREAGGP